MKRKEFFTVAISSSLLAIVFSGCDQPQPNTSTTVTTPPPPTPAAKKTLKMITSPDYPPYEFYDSTTGEKKIVGFDIDIAKKITKKLGYGLEVVATNFDEIIPQLAANKADFAMAGLTPTAERKKQVDFSAIYYTAKNVLVSKKGSNIKTTQSLQGKKVGVQKGSIQENLAKDIAKTVSGLEIVTFNKISDMIQALDKKTINAAIIEDTVSKTYVQADPELESHIIPNKGEVGSAIAFPKGSPLIAEFDKALKELVESKELEKLALYWFERELVFL